MKKTTNPPTELPVLLLGATGLLLLLFIRLYVNLMPALTQTEQDYASGKAVNLSPSIKSASLRQLLVNGNYYTDNRDIDLVTDSLVRTIGQVGSVDNVGALNKRGFAVTVSPAWKSPIGGIDFQSRVQASRQRMGFDSVLYQQELTNPTPLPATVSLGAGDLSLSGRVVDGASEQPMNGVLIQLQRHGISTPTATTDEKRFYARTDSDGQFSFTGLASDSGYSVVPLKPGYEFGTRQGTPSLTRSKTVSFSGRPHKIRLIGSVVYDQLKTDKAMTVRTPAEFRGMFWGVVALFFVAFWGVYFFWIIRRFSPDAFLLPILMLLTGISVLTLFSIQDPVQDTTHAYQNAIGSVIGIVALALISQVNVGKLYTHWAYDWLFTFRNRSFYKRQGWTWLVFAIGLAIVTLLVGSGPEGSGVKVNLNLGFVSFQPSELTKYLLLLFLAGFFAANEERIRELSDARWRLRINLGVLAGTGAILVLYLLLGDMGPALVMCFTFLFFYSIARGNVAVTFLAGAFYGLLLWFIPGLLATGISLAVVIGYLVWQKAFQSSTRSGWLALLAEAPIIVILIIAAFTFGDKLPAVGDRLADRKNMWLSPWDNDVYGGDHLAHSFWTLSSGGFSGQGLGKGFANTMPAAHTDMILPSVGEELGWLGLVAIILLFGILLHRTFLHARRAGQPFSFYLCAGIGIATGIQFLLIASGSVGLMPLTGVAVPFLSYGKISLILNLAAMGIVIGLSSRPGEAIQKAYLETYYDPVLLAGIVGFLVGMVILIGKLAFIQIWAGKEYIVKPTRVINRNGLPVYSYNPRIELLTRKLAAGTIYDRNRLVLATSDPELVRKNQNALRSTGLDPIELDQLTRKKLRRYYPFDEQLFFWVGDANTRLFWDQESGYYAEASHLSQLRGFDTQPRKSEFVTTRYKADRFSKTVSKNSTLVAYDYAALASMLRAGLDSKEVEALKAKNRDIRLSIDAGLQVDLQNAISRSAFTKNRTSVVVLDAKTGDMLASAVYPLPNLQTPEEMLLPERERIALTHPVTDRDLGMTYPTAPGSTAKILTAAAALNKLGLEGADVTYTDISFDEIIRKGTRESEPYNEPIDMRKAIVRSSNVYFIRTANEHKLDNEMANLYLATGMNIDYVGGYSFSPVHTDLEKDQIIRHWHDSCFVINRQFYQQWQGKKRNRYNSEFSGLAWGQGQLTATPVSIARMAAAIANKGKLQPTRYVLEIGGQSQPIAAATALINNPEAAALLASFMVEQSNPPGGNQKIADSRVAGKTGTPERRVKGKSRFDGWYVFFAPNANKSARTVVCVRIELGDASANAVQLANEQIVPVLKQRGYLGSF